MVRFVLITFLLWISAFACGTVVGDTPDATHPEGVQPTDGGSDATIVCCVLRGDVNASGEIDISDIVYFAEYLFTSGESPVCSEEADTDGSGQVDISDLTYIVAYMFQGGDPPVRCPVFLAGGVTSPGSGTTDSVFTYEVIFTDTTGFAPLLPVVVVDGASHVMSLVSGDVETGALYRLQMSLGEGSHTCRYQFRDYRDSLVSFPLYTYLAAPNVTEPGTYIAEDVIIMDVQDSTVLVQMSESELVFDYSGVAPDIAEGDVLVGSEGEGYLLRATHVSRTPGQIAVLTDSVALEDVVAEVDIDSTFVVVFSADRSDHDSFTPEYLAPGVTVLPGGIDLSGVKLYSGNAGNAEIEAVITDGRVEFTPSLDMGISIGWFRLKEFHTIAGGMLEFPCDIAVTATDGFEIEADTTLAKFSYIQTFYVAGGFPVRVKYTLSFIAGFEASAGLSGTVTYGFDFTNSVSAGARYENGSWSSVWNMSPAFNSHGVGWSAEASTAARVYIRPRLDVELYSSAGPYFYLEPYLAFDGFVQTSPWYWYWRLFAGLDGYLGFQAHILSWELVDYKRQIIGAQITLATDTSCSECILVKSEPTGASIYLDGTNMQRTTPDMLEDVGAGEHSIRLFKEGYNEYNEDFTMPDVGMYLIDAELGVPTPPLPVFTIDEPGNNEHFSSNVINVSGLIQLEDPFGTITPFTDDKAILTLNGDDQEIAVSAGHFSETVSITEGANTLQVRANSSAGETGVSDLITVYGDFGEPDIEITLTWNTPTSDLDLHVWNPNGEHCYWSNPSISDGFLDIDDVEGYGPETFTADNAISGTYVVQINCYSLDMDVYSDASVRLKRRGLADHYFGPHRFTVDDYMSGDPAAWWDVIAFGMSSDGSVIPLAEIPEWLSAKIKEDLAASQRPKHQLKR